MGSCRVLLLRGGATRTSTPSSSPATTPSTRQPGGRPSELALSTWPTRCSTRAEEATEVEPEEAAREQTPGSWLIIRETPIEINNQHLSPSFLATTTPLSLETPPRIVVIIVIIMMKNNTFHTQVLPGQQQPGWQRPRRLPRRFRSCSGHSRASWKPVWIKKLKKRN